MAKIKPPLYLPEPSAELVRQKIEAFNDQGIVTEAAIDKLLTAFPLNSDAAEVLIKVITINRIYSTNIFAVVPVAEMIVAAQLDDLLRAGDEKAVESIRRVSFMDQTGKQQEKNIYSFATKYCALHQPHHYAMYDGLVIEKLWQYQEQTQAKGKAFYPKFSWDDLKDYPKFKSIVAAFRAHFELEAFTLREIDKFLWITGKESSSAAGSSLEHHGEAAAQG
ncbi:hypothetical protein HLB42_09010 [Deinococcus sp. D7000]|nr:hypothetical protein HLB42_09010 [Deinococcus sp. D7000]